MQNIVLNLVGLFLLAIPLCNRRDTRGRGTQPAVFRVFLGVSAFWIILDAVAWVLDGKLPDIPGVYGGVLLVYFFMTTVISTTWLFYCDERLKYPREYRTLRRVLYTVPSLVNLLTLLATPLGGGVFTIDTDGFYHRGFLYFVHIAMVAISLAFSVGMIRRRTRDLSPLQHAEYNGLIIFLVPQIITVPLQLLFYGVSLIPLSISISVLLLYIVDLKRQLETDPLTGAQNRISIQRHLTWRLRNQGERGSLFLLMIDADRFKDINDRFGHTAGDRAVLEIADLLRDSCVSSDLLCRYGGDEFLILGWRLRETEIREFIVQIQNRIARRNEETTEPFALSISVGCAVYDAEHPVSPDEFLRRADFDMYGIKARKHGEERRES